MELAAITSMACFMEVWFFIKPLCFLSHKSICNVMTEKHKDGWPERFVLFDPLRSFKKIAKVILGPFEVPLYVSNHYDRSHFVHPLDESVEVEWVESSEGIQGSLDHLLDDVPLTVEDAVNQAVDRGRLSYIDGEQAIFDYHRVFHDYPDDAA